MRPSTRAEVEDALVRYCRGEMLLCELCAVVGVPKPTPEQSRISDRARKAEAEVARLNGVLSSTDRDDGIDAAEWIRRVSVGVGFFYDYDGPFVAAEADAFVAFVNTRGGK
jgi:hypothetical protein